MNENEFLKKVIPLFKQNSDVIVGPGDDCAVLKIDGSDDEYLLYAVDQVVSDVHYLFDSDDPELVGRKLVKRNISDIAAMGGEPFSAVITAAVSSNFQRLEKIYSGIAQEAEVWNMSICGGDYSSVKPRNLEVFTLSILGKVKKDKLCLRSNIKGGDCLFATGKFGNSFKSKHHLTFTPRLEQSRFLAGIYTNAMMDVSDGLLMDLKRFAEASKVTVSLFTDKILLRDGAKSISHGLTDGEDYELIFSVRPELENDLLKLWPFKDVELSRIGIVLNQIDSVRVKDYKTNSDLLAQGHLGFEHPL